MTHSFPTRRSSDLNLEEIPSWNNDLNILSPLNEPLKPTAHLQILYGNIAPAGSVAKITGKEGDFFKGRARVFDSEDEAVDTIKKGLIQKGDIVVIRYVGPKGGPGRSEEHTSELQSLMRISY